MLHITNTPKNSIEKSLIEKHKWQIQRLDRSISYDQHSGTQTYPMVANISIGMDIAPADTLFRSAA